MRMTQPLCHSNGRPFNAFGGLFIKQGFRLKEKAKPSAIASFLQDLQALKYAHKWSPKPLTLQLLSYKRSELHRLLDQSYMHHNDLSCCHLYEFGDKSSRFLARSIKLQQLRTYISKISCPSQGLVHISEAIAKAFRTYYSLLYNISPMPSDSSRQPCPDFLAHYIAGTTLHTLSPEAIDDPFITQEFISVIIIKKAQAWTATLLTFVLNSLTPWYKSWKKTLNPSLRPGPFLSNLRRPTSWFCLNKDSASYAS